MHGLPAISPRRTVPAILLLCISLMSWGIAHASFPPSSPGVADTWTFAEFGQDVAVNTSNNIVYTVATGANNRVTAYNPMTNSVAAQRDVGGFSLHVAVNSRTGSVYVPDGTNLQVMSGDLSTQINHPLPFAGSEVAVHPADDTVYVTYPGFNINKLSILNGDNLDDSVIVQMNSNQYSIAVNPHDDTVYVGYSSGTPLISMVSGNGSSVQDVSIPVQGFSLMTLAVHPIDGTVYMGNLLGSSLLVAPPNLSTFAVVPLPSPITGVSGLSVSPDGSTLWVAARPSSSQGMALKTSDLDDSYIFTTGPSSVAVSATNRFAAMIENSPGALNILAWPGAATSVVPSSSSVAGGVAVTITGAGFIPGVTSVTVGGNALLSAQVVDSTTITGVLPPGAAGQADVVVSTWALTDTLVGAVSYVAPPPPPVPASAPMDVGAVAGDASAVVSWVPPASSGSFPVSTYQVRATPDERVCLVSAPATSCEITGLTNDVEYSFEVRALTGAGWSAWSQPSGVVTPMQTSIMITGSRSGSRVVLSGASSGLGMGGVLRPWVRVQGQPRFTQGSAQILVDELGEFTWQRRGAKRMAVYVATPDGSTKSNRLTLPKSGAQSAAI